MRETIITSILVLIVASVTLAGGGPPPQQQMGPLQPNVVVQSEGGNFGAYVGAAATLASAIIGYLGVRYGRKKKSKD
ncbi:MAG: hypothetical protein GF334_01440 [Candidatus Altiarchaeales archaeon]|nr:hypothetical protein [Candidatus Altiarchaeales archaeon]